MSGVVKKVAVVAAVASVAATEAEQAKAMAGYAGVLVPGALKEAMAAVGAKSADLWKVPVDEIHVEPGFNIRIPSEQLDEHIRSLADSIKANGFFQHSPLAGYVKKEGAKEVVIVTDGHCRLAATKLAISEGAEIATLPMVMSPRGTNVEDLTAAMVSKSTGKQLSLLERGIAVKRLFSFGWDEKKIAEKTGMSAQEIDKAMTLLEAPVEIREMVSSGEVAANVAVAEMREKGSGAVDSLKQMSAKAKAKGHVKVTSKHRAGAALAKVIKREGSGMVDLLRSIRADESYAVVSESLKAQIEALLAKVAKAVEADQPQAEASSSSAQAASKQEGGKQAVQEPVAA